MMGDLCCKIAVFSRGKVSNTGGSTSAQAVEMLLTWLALSRYFSPLVEKWRFDEKPTESPDQGRTLGCTIC